MCHEEAEHMMEEIKVMQKLKGSGNIVSIEDPSEEGRFYRVQYPHGMPHTKLKRISAQSKDY